MKGIFLLFGFLVLVKGLADQVIEIENNNNQDNSESNSSSTWVVARQTNLDTIQDFEVQPQPLQTATTPSDDLYTQTEEEQVNEHTLQNTNHKSTEPGTSVTDYLKYPMTLVGLFLILRFLCSTGRPN
jgi:hypothetical protein